MSSHRNLRMAEAIREVVASAILFDVADPRIRAVTVLRVEVAEDLRQAKVFVSVMGTETERNLALRGLKHAVGFFHSKVADRLQIRFTPTLRFQLDDSVKKSVEMGQLIDQALASDRRPTAVATAAETSVVREQGGENPVPDDPSDDDPGTDTNPTSAALNSHNGMRPDPS
jgi:ribosome-binding factor A